jgi:hypothetical protein
MKRKNILAHRGCWTQPDLKNSFEALKLALDSGFGIETDIRDCSGSLVISHDPPKGDVFEAKTFFELYDKASSNSRVALNIKADGLQQSLLILLHESGAQLENFYVFDMSVPDALRYVDSDLPAYTRLSEYEVEPPLLSYAAGAWVDNFTGNFPQVSEAEKILAIGKRACIVSSELHKRDYHVLWDDIAAAGLHKNPLFELCTDFPYLAYDFFKA